jgi:hypothetical protein
VSRTIARSTEKRRRRTSLPRLQPRSFLPKNCLRSRNVRWRTSPTCLLPLVVSVSLATVKTRLRKTTPRLLSQPGRGLAVVFVPIRLDRHTCTASLDAPRCTRWYSALMVPALRPLFHRALMVLKPRAIRPLFRKCLSSRHRLHELTERIH